MSESLGFPGLLRGTPVAMLAQRLGALVDDLARVEMAGRPGVDKRVHAHGLRHSHATELVGAGVPLHVTAGQLGDASTATTDAYLAKIAPAERIAAMRAARRTLDA